VIISKDMKISEILKVNPKASDILSKAGMHCPNCPSNQSETLEEACSIHDLDLNDLLLELNNN
jgi:hydroxylamine reductase